MNLEQPNIKSMDFFVNFPSLQSKIVKNTDPTTNTVKNLVDILNEQLINTIENNNFDLFKKIIYYGADPKKIDDILFWISKSGNLQILKLTLQIVPNLKVKDDDLIEAIKSNKIDIVRYYLDNYSFSDKDVFIFWAKKYCLKEILELLLSYNFTNYNTNYGAN